MQKVCSFRTTDIYLYYKSNTIMIVQAIKQNKPANEKLLAIARRLKSGKCTESVFCDFNTIPGSLRIFWSNSDVQVLNFNGDFKEAIKYIYSIY